MPLAADLDLGEEKNVDFAANEIQLDLPAEGSVLVVDT